MGRINFFPGRQGKQTFRDTDKEVSKNIELQDEEILERYQAIYTAVVIDILHEEHGMREQALPSNLLPLVDGTKVAGFAFTIKGTPTHLPEPEDAHEQRAAMIDALYPGSLVVWDTCKDEGTAHYGEMMTAASMMQGCVGAIVDGGVRDVVRIIETGFKVWSRYRTPASMADRFNISGWQQPVRIGRTEVVPGDLVFADMDGIVVVPRAISVEVLLRAEDRNRAERSWRQIIASGLSPAEVVLRGGKF